LNLVRLPFKNITDPTKYTSNNVYNFYLNVESDVKIGIWHYIPKSLEYDNKIDSVRSVNDHFNFYSHSFVNKPVIIYIHGNDDDRAGFDRVKLCERLCNLGYNVFAIDYRGFGDSTGYPSERGIVKDIIHLHDFIKTFQDSANIYLWGHSLGTGISCHVGKVLTELNSKKINK
jgi:abhydrolase domain-containing protein 12